MKKVTEVVEQTDLINDEEKETGLIKFSDYVNFFRFSKTWILFIFFLVVQVIVLGNFIMIGWWLGKWAKADPKTE